MKKKLIKIGEVSAFLGVSAQTIRNWEKTGELVPLKKTKGGTRYYLVSEVEGFVCRD